MDHFEKFKPTNISNNETSRARNKNKNLPILQMMYNGDEREPLVCKISGQPGWVDFPCLVTSNIKTRFNIDFNHIRQESKGNGRAGNSLDKNNNSPSDLFRGQYLLTKPICMFEFMTMMPVSQEVHAYISQDSAIGNITLTNFNKKYWPWVLADGANYERFINKYKIKTSITYDWMIDHLSSIEHPSLHSRLRTITPIQFPTNFDKYSYTLLEA